MIREPYNVSPYNEAKDLSQNPQFSFTFSGDALVGYDYKILNNSNKNNILKNWSATQENKYIPTVDSGKVAIPTTEANLRATVFNDEPYYFNCEVKNINLGLYNNKGLIWKLRLFEDNVSPSNNIQSGTIDFVRSVNDEEAIVQGTITGQLETSDSAIFRGVNWDGSEENKGADIGYLRNDETGIYTPNRWTNNVMRIGQYNYSINDYKTVSEEYYTTQKPDTYYVGTKAITDGTPTTYYDVTKELQYYTYTYKDNGAFEATIHKSSVPLVRSNFSGISKNAIYKNGNGGISSFSDRVSMYDLADSSTNNQSIEYSLGNTSEVKKTYTSNGEQKTEIQKFDVIWGNTSKENISLFNFTIKQKKTTYGQDGKAIVVENIISGNRSILGLSPLLYLDSSTGSYRNSTTYLTQEEIDGCRNKVLASTVINLMDGADHSAEYHTLKESDIDFDKDTESIIYTVEQNESVIRYNETTTKNTSLTRSLAKEQGFLDPTASDVLVLLSTTDNSAESSDKFFTYDEVQKIEDSNYGIYTLGQALSADKTELIPPSRMIPKIGSLTDTEAIYFSVLNNYYDSNYYYFVNQTQPALNFKVKDVPYYSFTSYKAAVDSGQKPTTTEDGLENNFYFEASQVQLVDLSSNVGSSINPLVTLQRFFPISASLAGLSYNFKYYKYKIYGGLIDEKGNIIYNDNNLYESDKIFSRDILIDYNNYVTDYDRYKIELMLATSENGFYYYYTYLYPTIDMFQNDEKDDRFAYAEYDSDKGAAKISWTQDNAYPPSSKDFSETEYGTYIVKGKEFPLKAFLLEDEGYLTYYHKGSEKLNINPLHDFQVSFAINKVVKGLDKITIDPLIGFYNSLGGASILLKIKNNVFELRELGSIKSDDLNYNVIDVAYSLQDVDNNKNYSRKFYNESDYNSLTGENHIFQYGLPYNLEDLDNGKAPFDGQITTNDKTVSCSKLPAEGAILPPSEQDLSKYCYHFYLFPWKISDGSAVLYYYKLVRFYNVNSAATKDLIMESDDEWRLGYYGKNAGNNADSSADGTITDASQTQFDTSEYISFQTLLGEGKTESTFTTGLSRVSLYGPIYYYGIFDVNRRGKVSSADNFILNFNDGIIGYSDLTQQVYGYRLFRNVYENANVNDRDAAMNFIQQMDNIFVVVCGTITLENKDKSPISRYSDIVDNGVYVTEWSSDGIIPISRISGIELKQLVNRSFDSTRQEMDQYFAKKNLSINFLTEDYQIIYDTLDNISTPNMISNDLIAEIDVLNQTISSKNGMYYIYDYNIPNKGFFRYQIVPLLRNETYNVLIAKINDLGETVLKIDDEQWHMTSLKYRTDGSYAPKDTWTFLLGVQTAQYTQNFTKTIQSGFSPYPKVMTSMTNYKTTQFSGYLGKFSFGTKGTANSYEDTINIIEKWNKFAYENNQILVKDPKGHVFVATISATSDSSDAMIEQMPTQVTCTLTQVGDTDSFKVYSL